MAVVGDVLHYGPDTMDGLPLVVVNGDGVLEPFSEGNLAADRAGKPVAVYVVRPTEAKTAGVELLPSAPVWPNNFRARPAATVNAEVLKNAGARPWDRDDVDQRIVRQVVEGKGRMIDSQDQVGGFPQAAMTKRTLTVPAEGVDAWLAGFTPSGKQFYRPVRVGGRVRMRTKSGNMTPLDRPADDSPCVARQSPCDPACAFMPCASHEAPPSRPVVRGCHCLCRPTLEGRRVHEPPRPLIQPSAPSTLWRKSTASSR